jgi:tRNA(fMet)-specific endonuclease VapC
VAYILDTNVAVYLRDGDPVVTARIIALEGVILLSVISRVDLEGGVYREPVDVGVRRSRLDKMLGILPVLDFGGEAADAYRSIVEAAGYSKRKIVDRMIAAQALAHRATLVTFNADGFRDIPGLSLLVW